MQRMSFHSRIIQLLILFRLLPSGKNKACDATIVAFLILFSIGNSIAYNYVMWSVPGFFQASIAGVFKYASTLLVPCLYVTLMIPALAFLCHICPIIVAERNLPNPMYLQMFMFNRTIQFINCVLQVWYWSDVGVSKLTYGISIAFVLGEAMSLLMGIFIFGVFLSATCNTIQDGVSKS